jgi:chromosome segregation ATPase
LFISSVAIIIAMSRIRIDPAAIQEAERAVANAEVEETSARAVVNQLEEQKRTLQWNHQRAGYEHHSATSAAGLYMTAYGSSRAHTDRCNRNMDRKEAVDQEFERNMEALRNELKTAEKNYEEALKKLVDARSQLTSAKRGF